MDDNQVELFAQISEYAESIGNFFSHHLISFGEHTIKFSIDDQNEVGRNISEAFTPSHDLKIDFEIIVIETLNDLKLPKLVAQLEKRTDDGLLRHSERFDSFLSTYSGHFSIFDRDRKRVVVITRDLNLIPRWELLSPLIPIFNWFANLWGGTLIHAAVLQTNNIGLLLVGKGGIGKSTTAIYAAINGFSILSDDISLFSDDKIYAIFSRGKIIEGEFLEEMRSMGLKTMPPSLNTKTGVDLRMQAFPFISKITPSCILHPTFLDPLSLPPSSKKEALLSFLPASMVVAGNTRQSFLSAHTKLIEVTTSAYLPLTGNLKEDFQRLKSKISGLVDV